mgnify:CR=1 FL=1
MPAFSVLLRQIIREMQPGLFAIPIDVCLWRLFKFLVDVDHGNMQLARPSGGFEEYGRATLVTETAIGIFCGRVPCKRLARIFEDGIGFVEACPRDKCRAGVFLTERAMAVRNPQRRQRCTEPELPAQAGAGDVRHQRIGNPAACQANMPPSTLMAFSPSIPQAMALRPPLRQITSRSSASGSTPMLRYASLPIF